MKWMNCNSLIMRTAFISSLLCCASVASAQGWTVQTLQTRVLADGQPAKIAIAFPQATPATANTPPIRHVLVYPQPLGVPQLAVTSGNIDLTVGGTWMRALPHLQQQGVSLVYVDVPSDAQGRGLISRPPREVRQDLAAVAKQTQQLFPGVQMHLAGFAVVAPLLDIAGDLEGFNKIVVAASALGLARTSDWSGLRKPVMMLHAPSAQCDPAPFPEAKELAMRSRFTLVQVGYERQDSRVGCGAASQHVMEGQEAALAKTVADWLDGKETPPVIGYASPQVAWREEVITYTAPGTFGSNQLEATLLLPEARRFGNGPYPVMVFNHGDIELDHSAHRYKSRIREMVVAREFLRLGVSVLMPARRGVGMSQGSYPKGFSAGDADATYKARVHAEDILPALAWLKTRPELDASKVIMAGQSAGGYSTMYIASQNPAGVVGAIDFSGGRTDMTRAGGAGHLNQMMVNGFTEFGKVTRIPTFWVFAENDSRYTANTIRASHEAFQAAGGKARLLLSPPIEGDGHHVYNKPAVWRGALKEYLAEIGVAIGAK
jgi:dienelactone hydrolase